MNFNNRNKQLIYGYGCSMLGLFLGLTIISLIIRGSLIFLFRYFWLILILGAVVWVFRKYIIKDNSQTTRSNDKNNWQRDFENRENTSYDNIKRDFEEIDDE